MKWKQRIQPNDKEIDLSGTVPYKLIWDETSEVVELYDCEVHLPAAPPDEQIINFGLDEHLQIFRKTYIPDQVRFPKKDFGRQNWTEKEIDAFVEGEFLRRKNGLWFFIKGKKTYIPGALYFKMNYWASITNAEFVYRHTDWKFFNFFMFVKYHPKHRGLADFKCRQLGDTENVICEMYEYGSRVRGALNSMQSFVNEDHVVETYNRLLHGHKNMIWYMKPMNKGTDSPVKGLILDYPAKYRTHSAMKKSIDSDELVNMGSYEDYQYPPIGSRFKYGVSKLQRFDGSTGIGRAYGDEFAKSAVMDPVEWIQTMSEATYNETYGKKMGLLVMTSTAEEVTGDSLKWARTIWNESDPRKLTPMGSTTNGLVRCFRSAKEKGEPDRWGFVDEEAREKEIKAKIKAMEEAGNRRGAITYRRKNPLTIEDVFLSANNLGQFHVENLQDRFFYLDELGKNRAVRGNLVWKDGIKDSEVIWIPNPNGRWLISKHPHDFNLKSNARSMTVAAQKPANSFFFSSGIDPIDAKNVLSSERSSAGMAIIRRFDPNIDSGESLYYTYDDEIKGIRKGDPVNLGSNFETNRFVCTYIHEPKDPTEFYEDVILTHVYYGTDFLVEKQKAGALIQYLTNRNYKLYIGDKPTTYKNYKGQVEKEGVTATQDSFRVCFDLIMTYTSLYMNACDHIDLVKQWMSMNWDNRGEHDLGVAAGWALYAATVPKSKINLTEKQAKLLHFSENSV